METPAAGEMVRAYVSRPLPPDPPIDFLFLLDRLTRAKRALGCLDGVTMMLPRQELFLYMDARKEAVLSSRIEGTQSTLADLLRFEQEAMAGQPVYDAREVSNCGNAPIYGLERMDSLPLSLRLIREMHVRLLQGSRGGTRNPGEFRRSQNWIGGTRPGHVLFVPPPPGDLAHCLDAFERFMRDRTARLPALVKAGLLHVQFEAIHPFLDGNGRIGRLLVTLFRCAKGVLQKLLLDLSLFFKSRRSHYYRLLQEVREQGAWEAWLEFFLEGVAETADHAVLAASRVVELFEWNRERIAKASARAGPALRRYEALQEVPYATAGPLVQRSRLSAPTADAVLTGLEQLGIVDEVTGRCRGCVFASRAYLEILNEGATPLAAWKRRWLPSGLWIEVLRTMPDGARAGTDPWHNNRKSSQPRPGPGRT